MSQIETLSFNNKDSSLNSLKHGLRNTYEKVKKKSLNYFSYRNALCFSETELLGAQKRNDLLFQVSWQEQDFYLF